MPIDTDAEIARAWLTDVIKASGLKTTPFAKRAGLAPSTLLRALDPDNPTALERRSISKIMQKFGVPGPYNNSAAPQNYPPGFAEPELLAVESDSPVFAGLSLTPNQYVKVVNTRALELAGYMPGDTVCFDMSVLARAGDAVEANVYNLQRGGAETVLRAYEPPYLVVRSMDLAISPKPHLVDDERVKIMAVAVGLWRARA